MKTQPAEQGGQRLLLTNLHNEAMPLIRYDQADFALPADGVSAPLKSAFGLHVVHVKSITPGVTKTYDEVKEQIRKDLALAKAGDDMVSVVNQLDDALAGGASVTDAAQQLNLTAQTYDAADPSGKGRDGKDLDIVPEILQLAQQTEAGQTSLVSTLSDGYGAAVVTFHNQDRPKLLALFVVDTSYGWRIDDIVGRGQSLRILLKLR